jgi:hypothetical protein
MNHIEWKKPEQRLGPQSCYGYWEGAKCFNIYWQSMTKSYTGPHYRIKCGLPGFREDLPLQVSEEAAQAFCEKMLTRWVAKRGLLFKAHIIVTDAMDEAAFKFLQANEFKATDREMIRGIVTAALQARG